MQNGVPKGQLLVMDVRDGWEPLCKFLKKERPGAPFPSEHEVAYFLVAEVNRAMTTPSATVQSRGHRIEKH